MFITWWLMPFCVGEGCGEVVQSHLVVEGAAFRKFEGEEDKNHHGPAASKLYSSAYSLRTTLGTGRGAEELR